MIQHVLDTDTLTLLEEGHPKIGAHFLLQPLDSVAIIVLSVEEQLTGWYAAIRQAKRAIRAAWAYQRLTDNIRFLARLQILTYDQQAMHRFEELCKRKIKIGRTDLRIASIVLQHGLILVTRNLHDFQQVPGLQIEDWSK